MAGRTKTRLIFAIVTTTLEEVALVAVVIWGLPRIGINIPVWGLILMMVAWLSYTIYSYRLGSRALKRKPVIGLTAMIGNKGKVIKPLTPEGSVKVGSELWRAVSVDVVDVTAGEEVVVVGQDGLRLIVCRSTSVESAEFK